MKKFKPSEHNIQEAILGYLNATGWLAFRMNAGMVAVGEGRSRRMIRMLPPGFPDIMAFKKDQPALAVEVKKEKNKPTFWQERMLEDMRRHGVATIVARSVDEVEKFVKML